MLKAWLRGRNAGAGRIPGVAWLALGALWSLVVYRLGAQAETSAPDDLKRALGEIIPEYQPYLK